MFPERRDKNLKDLPWIGLTLLIILVILFIAVIAIGYYQSQICVDIGYTRSGETFFGGCALVCGEPNKTITIEVPWNAISKTDIKSLCSEVK